jgi:transcriptional regulator with XRE-family HTH domain
VALPGGILLSGLTRIERGERRVDVDDLLALSVVLGVTPNRLLLPDYPQRFGDGRDIVPVVGGVRADIGGLWDWAADGVPLVRRGEGGVALDEPTVQDVAAAVVANMPHRFQR